jgi:hypothetical protein
VEGLMQSRAESGLSSARKMLYPGELKRYFQGAKKSTTENKHSAVSIQQSIKNWVIANIAFSWPNNLMLTQCFN